METKRVYLSLMKQDKQNCGQTCLAMLSGKTIREIEEIVGREKGIALEGLKLGCMVLGIPIIGQWSEGPHKTRWGEREFPSSCLLYVRRRGGNRGYHAMVCICNMIHDPNGFEYHCGELDHKWELLEYLELDVDTEFYKASEHTTKCRSVINLKECHV